LSLKDTCDIEKIHKKQAKEIIAKYHYLGSKGFRSSASYGLFNGRLIGACVFHGVSAPETVVGAFGLDRKDQDGIWELGRLVIDKDYNGKNYTSYLVGNSIKQLRKEYPVRAIISYADSSLHNGGIYRATNFVYCGLTAPKKDFYVAGKIQERGKTKGVDGVWKPRPRKHRYVLIYDKQLHLKWETLNFKASQTVGQNG